MRPRVPRPAPKAAGRALAGRTGRAPRGALPRLTRRRPQHARVPARPFTPLVHAPVRVVARRGVPHAAGRHRHRPGRCVTSAAVKPRRAEQRRAVYAELRQRGTDAGVPFVTATAAVDEAEHSLEVCAASALRRRCVLCATHALRLPDASPVPAQVLRGPPVQAGAHHRRGGHASV